jgi:hypothetical protein
VEIKSLGFGLGLSRKVYQDFEVGLIITMLNLTLIRQKTQVLKLVLHLKHRVKASFGNENYLRTLVLM